MGVNILPKPITVALELGYLKGGYVNFGFGIIICKITDYNSGPVSCINNHNSIYLVQLTMQ